MARKKLFEGIGCYIKAALCIVLMMVSVILINPIVLWLLALVAPKWTAGMSYNAKSVLVFNLPFEGNRWIWRILPWRCRKEYIAQDSDFEKFCSEDRMRFFIECVKTDEEKAKKLFKVLTPVEKRKVFSSCRGFFVRVGESLSIEQFKTLISDDVEVYANSRNGLNAEEFDQLVNMIDRETRPCAVVEVIRRIVNTFTPSFEQFKIMAKSKALKDVLTMAIIKHGIDRTKVSELLEVVQDEDQNDVFKALSWHTQLMIVRSSNLDDFRNLCAVSDVAEFAQSCMTAEQYKVFHDAGQKLSDKAVVNLLQTRDSAFAKMIFEYEPNNGLNSELAKAIVEADHYLKILLLRMKKTAPLEELDSE